MIKPAQSEKERISVYVSDARISALHITVSDYRTAINVVDLIGEVVPKDALADRRAAVVEIVHPAAASFSRVFCERAVGDCWPTPPIIVHPAAVSFSRVSCEYAVGDSRVGAVI